MPYQRNDHFTGRKELVKELRSKLVEVVPGQWNHRLALYGLGGVGKTQLALHYAYKYQSEYERVYWISAATQSTLITGFGEIAKQANIAHGSNADLVEAVVNWLNGIDNWLLVIDNLDEINIVDGYLPASMQRYKFQNKFQDL
jgi:cellulose biosynthesis protein BcsQ